MTGRGPLRVATVNLQHATPADGGSATAASLLAAGRALAELDLDVVALQEVDRGQRRSRYVDQARVLARLVGARWWRFAAAEIGPRGGPRLRPPLPALSWQPAYGVALLSRLPVRTWHTWSFPGQVRLLRRDHGLAAGGPVVRLGPAAVRRDEPRVALAAELDAPGGPLAVAATHLSTDPASATAQLGAVVDRLSRLPGEHVLAGDLNLQPGDLDLLPGDLQPLPDAVTRLSAPAHVAVGPASALAALAVAATYPARAPARQIDHVLGSAGLRGGAAEVHRLPVSDHAALVATVHDLRPAARPEPPR